MHTNFYLSTLASFRDANFPTSSATRSSLSPSCNKRQQHAPYLSKYNKDPTNTQTWIDYLWLVFNSHREPPVASLQPLPQLISRALLSSGDNVRHAVIVRDGQTIQLRHRYKNVMGQAQIENFQLIRGEHIVVGCPVLAYDAGPQATPINAECE